MNNEKLKTKREIPWLKLLKTNKLRHFLLSLTSVLFLVPLTLILSVKTTNYNEIAIKELINSGNDTIRLTKSDQYNEDEINKIKEIYEDDIIATFSGYNLFNFENNLENKDINFDKTPNISSSFYLNNTNFELKGSLPKKGEVLLTDYHYDMFKEGKFIDISIPYNEDQNNYSSYEDYIGSKVFNYGYSLKISGFFNY